MWASVFFSVVSWWESEWVTEYNRAQQHSSVMCVCVCVCVWHDYTYYLPTCWPCCSEAHTAGEWEVGGGRRSKTEPHTPAAINTRIAGVETGELGDTFATFSLLLLVTFMASYRPAGLSTSTVLFPITTWKQMLKRKLTHTLLALLLLLFSYIYCSPCLISYDFIRNHFIAFIIILPWALVSYKPNAVLIPPSSSFNLLFHSSSPITDTIRHLWGLFYGFHIFHIPQ